MSVEGQKAQSAVVGGAASERAKRDGDMWAGLSWTNVTVTATSSDAQMLRYSKATTCIQISTQQFLPQPRSQH